MNKELQHTLTDSISKVKMVDFLIENPSLFDETISISLGNSKPQAWRAAWLIGHCIKKNDIRVKSHINSILKVIKEKEDGHQREFIKILLKMVLTEKQEGVLFDKSISIWEDISKSASLRATAFSAIIIIIEKYPELLVEIEFLTQSHYIETLSPGIKRSIT
ncbi:MAG: hypothetical protein L3J41_11845 [Melioribacteraceae bacterium]|nr:hypothetical protein [Melioribacteraceae bacterium]